DTGWEELGSETTRVTFRALGERERDRYVRAGEWEGRAGGYAIQGLGAGLVERIEGDYLNVVGLPTALLVRLLAARYPGVYGFGWPRPPDGRGRTRAACRAVGAPPPWVGSRPPPSRPTIPPESARNRHRSAPSVRRCVHSARRATPPKTSAAPARRQPDTRS